MGWSTNSVPHEPFSTPTPSCLLPVITSSRRRQSYCRRRTVRGSGSCSGGPRVSAGQGGDGRASDPRSRAWIGRMEKEKGPHTHP